MPMWNLWHGCTKYSPGCKNCYVYRSDAKYDRDATIVRKTSNFTLPIKRKRNGEYKIPGGQTIYTCFTSDFFLDTADAWRGQAWDMIKQRDDLMFLIITKRIERFDGCVPPDWGDGYDNVTICCTCENEQCAKIRLPIFLKAPIKHKIIVCEPLLGNIDLSPYLTKDIIEVIAGGESGSEARVCDYDWILNIRQACVDKNVSFVFKQTGAYLKKDSKVYRVLRRYQHSQAKKANINWESKK